MHLHQADFSPGPNRDFAQTARHLFASTMYPFQSLQMMLLVWQRGEQADQELSDSSDEDGEVEGQDGDTTNPTVRYSTQKAYERYVICSSLPFT